MKLSEAVREFIFDRETFCTAKTVSNYKSTLKYFSEYIYSVHGDIEIVDISVDDLKGYVHFLKNRKKLQSHPYMPTQNKRITDTSIRTYLIDVRAFFNYLYSNDLVKEYIFKKFKLVRREKKLVLPLTVEQVQLIDDLYSEHEEKALRNWCIIHLMLDAGFRVGDVVNLLMIVLIIRIIVLSLSMVKDGRIVLSRLHLILKSSSILTFIYIEEVLLTILFYLFAADPVSSVPDRS